MIKNKFIDLEKNLTHISLEFSKGKNTKGKTFAFMGAHNDKNLPTGFVRCVNYFGNIFEGHFTPNFKMSGFCVTYLGNNNKISAGWYRNNVRHGNWMSLNGHDLSIIESGWYKDGYHVGEMKGDI